MVLFDFRTVRFLAACACSRRRQICRLRWQSGWMLFVRRELLTWTATTFAGTMRFLLLLLLLFVWRWHCSSSLRLKFVAQKLITNVIAAIAATVPADSSIYDIIVVIVLHMAIPFFVLHWNRWWCWRWTESKLTVATLSQWWTLPSMLRSRWEMRLTNLIEWKKIRRMSDNLKQIVNWLTTQHN